MGNIFKIFKIILSSLLAMSLLGYTVVQLIIIYSSDELNKLIVVEVFEPGPRASSARVLATDGIVNYEVHHCPMKTQVANEDQNYQTSAYTRDYSFIGMVRSYDPETGMAIVEQRNKMVVGDEIEVFSTVIGDYVICTSIRVWWVWISFALSVAFVIGVCLLVKEFIEKGSEFEF